MRIQLPAASARSAGTVAPGLMGWAQRTDF